MPSYGTPFLHSTVHGCFLLDSESSGRLPIRVTFVYGPSRNPVHAFCHKTSLTCPRRTSGPAHRQGNGEDVTGSGSQGPDQTEAPSTATAARAAAQIGMC